MSNDNGTKQTKFPKAQDPRKISEEKKSDALEKLLEAEEKKTQLFYPRALQEELESSKKPKKAPLKLNEVTNPFRDA